MIDFREFESNGRFGLTIERNAYDSDCGDLGRGDAVVTCRFETAEGRTYFKQAEMERERSRALARDLEWLHSSIGKLLTPSGNVRRKVARALVEQSKAATARWGKK